VFTWCFSVVLCLRVSLYVCACVAVCCRVLEGGVGCCSINLWLRVSMCVSACVAEWCRVLQDLGMGWQR